MEPGASNRQLAARTRGWRARAHCLATVNHVGQAIIAAQTLDEMLEGAAVQIQEQLRVEIACLILVDPASGSLLSHRSTGREHQAQHRTRLARRQDIIRRVLQSGHAVCVNDVLQDPHFYTGVNPDNGFPTCSILCVPLTLSGQVMGVIEVVNKMSDEIPGALGVFDEQDQHVLEDVAVLVAMAAENARQQRERREKAALQAVRETVVTLAHHVNNPLQGLVGAAEMLWDRLENGTLVATDATAPGQSPAELLEVIVHKAQEISAVLLLLQETSLPHTTPYLGKQRMLDIAQELKKRMAAQEQT